MPHIDEIAIFYMVSNLYVDPNNTHVGTNDSNGGREYTFYLLPTEQHFHHYIDLYNYHDQAC